MANGHLQVELARQLATEAHRGQVDKAGKPYIDHPARVATRVQAWGFEWPYVAVAWLHDVLEDTPFTIRDLLRCGVSPRVVAGVDAITKRNRHEPYLHYVHGVALHDLARIVKLADVGDNANEERLAQLEPDTAERLRRKYAAARVILITQHPINTTRTRWRR